ncbi:transcription factor asR4-like [Drosophila ficusphila]|uniref:transcription factor asR4-like n=1 Tax=Drosophila ficusphila TaxID=30025 RepID=UPI0007E79BFE|nr:transcription factor asR4-like [Drosophila ficusphila]
MQIFSLSLSLSSPPPPSFRPFTSMPRNATTTKLQCKRQSAIPKPADHAPAAGVSCPSNPPPTAFCKLWLQQQQKQQQHQQQQQQQHQPSQQQHQTTQQQHQQQQQQQQHQLSQQQQLFEQQQAWL